MQTTCSDGIDSYGRKKRAIAKRQAEENDVEDISVGSSISITTEEVTIESKYTAVLKLLTCFRSRSCYQIVKAFE